MEKQIYAVQILLLSVRETNPGPLRGSRHSNRSSSEAVKYYYSFIIQLFIIIPLSQCLFIFMSIEIRSLLKTLSENIDIKTSTKTFT